MSTLASFLQAATIADLRDFLSTASFTQVEALAQTDGFSSVASFVGASTLADLGALLSSITATANWKLISSGLSGVSYEQTGNTAIPGVEVLVFRDDTNILYATQVTDAQGYWFIVADPNFAYWISYWKGVTTGDRSENVAWRTDRALAPVDTVIATGT